MRNRAEFRADWSNHCRDLAIFVFFRMAAAGISDFTFFMVGTVKKVELRHCATFRLNRSNVAKIWRFCDFFRHHLEFLKFQILNGRTHHECRTASSCQISLRLIKPLPSYRDVLFFNLTVAAILDFKNFVEIARTAAEIWWFLIFHRWRPSSISNLWWVRWVHTGHLLVFITVQNLVGIDAVVLILCTFFDFASLAWKRLFMCGLNGEPYEKKTKEATFAGVRVVWAEIKRDIGQNRRF